jgi:hypothetical protein
MDPDDSRKRALSEEELEYLRRALSNSDLRRLINVASHEVTRRKHMGLDLAAHGNHLTPNLNILLQESLRAFGNNFLLAFNVRMGVGVLLRFFRLLRTQPSSAASFSALMGQETLHSRVDAVSLGLFIGSLTGGFKFLRGLLHHLRQKEDGYNTFAAGTLAGLSFFFVDPSRRRTLALYLFARATEGLYNSSKARGW